MKSKRTEILPNLESALQAYRHGKASTGAVNECLNVIAESLAHHRCPFSNHFLSLAISSAAEAIQATLAQAV
jgi:hypothetical protein